MHELDLYGHVSEPIAVLRKRYLRLCDNNYCAAMLLDRFCANCLTAQEYNKYEDINDLGNEHTITRISQLQKELFGLFSFENIADALKLLELKGYISYDVNLDSEATSDNFTDWELDIEYLKENVNVASGWNPDGTLPYSNDEDMPQPKVTKQTKPQIDRTEWLEEYEIGRIKSHNNRAIKARLKATLTIDQWKETVEHFGYKCAYCQINKYTLIEHFTPITHGGGTTKQNCVPGCSACNSIKKGWNPLTENRPSFPVGMEEALKRVWAYLTSL